MALDIPIPPPHLELADEELVKDSRIADLLDATADEHQGTMAGNLAQDGDICPRHGWSMCKRETGEERKTRGAAAAQGVERRGRTEGRELAERGEGRNLGTERQEGGVSSREEGGDRDERRGT